MEIVKSVRKALSRPVCLAIQRVKVVPSFIFQSSRENIVSEFTGDNSEVGREGVIEYEKPVPLPRIYVS